MIGLLGTNYFCLIICIYFCKLRIKLDKYKTCTTVMVLEEQMEDNERRAYGFYEA